MQNNQQTGAVLSFIQETRSSWDKLKEEQRPIFIYGMGDGAIKINQAVPGYFGSGNLRDLTGIVGNEI